MSHYECKHDLAERETQVADGYCPICLVNALDISEEKLALAREGLERIYWALEDQCCEEQPIACSLRDIAEEALAKLAETK